MGNVSRETETLRKKMLEIKNPVTEMKTAFDGFINTLDTAEKRISKLEEMSIETSETEMQGEKRKKKTKQNIQELWDNYKR